MKSNVHRLPGVAELPDGAAPRPTAAYLEAANLSTILHGKGTDTFHFRTVDESTKNGSPPRVSLAQWIRGKDPDGDEPIVTGHEEE